VLRRRDSPSGSQEILVFLTAHGATRISAPGAGGAKNRFGAGTEPLVWGSFDLYQSPRRLYLKGVDVREDFWSIRGRRRALLTAVSWCGELAARLPHGAESDSLLSLLWGSMKNLASGIDPLLLDIRFAWRWGNLWGVAPQLDICSSCGGELLSGDRPVRRSQSGLICADCSRLAPHDGEVAPISVHTLRQMISSATMPRGAFASWAASFNPDPGSSPLGDCASWLYSFL
jgi:DNA repair protein RecO (recombination protein O)